MSITIKALKLAELTYSAWRVTNSHALNGWENPELGKNSRQRD